MKLFVAVFEKKRWVRKEDPFTILGISWGDAGRLCDKLNGDDFYETK